MPTDPTAADQAAPAGKIEANHFATGEEAFIEISGLEPYQRRIIDGYAQRGPGRRRPKPCTNPDPDPATSWLEGRG